MPSPITRYPMSKCRSLLFVFACALLSGCSGSLPHQQSLGITAEEAKATEDLQRLKDSHATLATRLAYAKREDFAADFALLDSLGERIVALQKKQLEKALDEKRIQEAGDYQNQVPLPELALLQEQLEADHSIHPSLLAEVRTPLEREHASSRNLIDRLSSEANRQDLTAERRAMVYHQLYVTSGDKQWLEIRDKQMDIIISAIQKAAENNNYSLSLENKIDFVRSIYVNQPAKAIEDMQAIYADLYMHRYSRLQTKGDRDGAFKVLQQLTEKRDYPQIVAKLGQRTNAIAADYAGYVSEGLSRRGNLLESLRNYEREIAVRTMLGLKPEPHPETANLVAQLGERFKKTKDKNPQAALGFLLAQEVLAPKSLDLSSSIDQQYEQIRGTTISRVGVQPFRSRYDNLSYGEVITPLISQYLHQLIGSDIKIVEGSPADADALVTGNILEVKVEGTQARNKKQMLVNVGQIERTNPAYLAWLELPPKERQKVARPDKTILEQKQENIFITAALHRKTGVIAVTYRLIDNKTKQVIYPDSITLQAQYEDESNEGLEVGELVVPYKLAKLPSDTEILQKLAQDVAEAIAGNLVGVLENQEIEYLKAADKSAAQNNCKEEVENLAKAVALLAKKGQKVEASEKSRQRLIQQSLSCF